MSTLSKVDPSTLGWVKTEIDESLKQARQGLEAYAENPSDDSQLRICTTYLHQVVGTLQMVELDGAAMLARETEHLADAILKGEVSMDEHVLETLVRGIVTLPDYLARLQFGQPDVPLRLLPVINSLRAAHRAPKMSEVDLFTPDLSVRPPSRHGDRPKLSDTEYSQLARARRPELQRALLAWLRDTGNREHLNRISEILTELEESTDLSVVEQLFWVSSGLMEALINGDLEPTVPRKKLLARLDMLIKKLIDRADKSVLRTSSETLVKSILLQVGHARSRGGRVGQLRQAFELDQLLAGVIDEAGADETVEMPSPEALQSVSAALGTEIETAQELLTTYFDSDQQDQAALEQLTELLRKMAGTLDMLGVRPLKTLVDELHSACQALARQEIQHPDAAMTMAGALLLVESSSRNIHRPDAAWKRHIDDATAALRHLVSGESGLGVEGMEISDATLSDSEFKQLLAVVAGEIRANLARIEEVLEGFVSNREAAESLSPVPQSLSQIQGALQILGQDRAAELSHDTGEVVQDLAQSRLTADSGLVDALAVSIGTIGAYIEGLERDRPNLDNLLDIAWRDLDRALIDKPTRRDEPGAILGATRHHLRTWLAGDADAANGLANDLDELCALAERQSQQSLVSACEALRDRARNSDSVPDDDTATGLRRAFADLADQAREQLTSAAGRSAGKAKAPASAPAKIAAVPPPARAERAAAPPRSKPPVEDMDPEILEIFIEDAREMIRLINATLPEWQAEPENQTVLTELRRAFHTLKGSGRMVGATEIAELGWSVENMLNRAREGKITPAADMFELLAAVQRSLPEMVDELEGGPSPAVDVAGLRARAEALANGQSMAPLSDRPADDASFGLDMGGDDTGLPTAGLEMEELTLGGLEPAADFDAASEPLADLDFELPGSLSDLEATVTETPAGAGRKPATATPLPTLDPTLLQIFTGETRGHLNTVHQEVATCRRSPCPVSGALLRAAHTLQGSARAVGLQPMAESCAEMEKLLLAVQLRQLLPEPEHLSLCERVADAVEQLLVALDRGGSMPADLAGEFQAVSAGLHAEIARINAEGPPPAAATRPAAPKPPSAGSAPMPRATNPAAAAARPSGPRAPVADELVREQVDPELLEIFLEEAADILSSIDESLTRWRSEPQNRTAVQELKRALHTLKGGARMAGAMTLGNLSHNTESLLRLVEERRAQPDGAFLDLVDEAHDALTTMVDQLQSNQPINSFTVLNGRIAALLAGRPDPGAAPAAHNAQSEPAAYHGESRSALPGDDVEPHYERRELADADETGGDAAGEGGSTDPTDRRGQIRVRTALLNELVNYAGEVSISRARMQQQVFGMRENLAELTGNVKRFRDQLRELEIQSESQILYRAQDSHDTHADFDPLEFDRFSRLQQLSRGLAESLHDLNTIQGTMDNFVGEAETVLHQQARLNTDLQEGLMRTRMVSISTQAGRLRHIVRQTGRELGKRAELQINGADVELDRTVLERMVGPFEHMIRNALDHGLEDEAARRRAGKPPAGKITLDARHEGSEVVIRFSDDGAGLDLERIRKKAIDSGLMNSDANLSDQELVQFILLPGFSTARKVTQLSGRGVGMDVVHNEVKQLNGSITVETAAGAGTTFVVRLPLTLSITQALMVYVGEGLYAVPLSSVTNILEVPVQKLSALQVGKKPLLHHEDQVYPFMHLATRLSVAPQPRTERKVPVLITRSGARELAIQVDGLAGTQEVVIKSVGAQLAELSGVAGATILGDGRVVLILDMGGLWMTEESIQVVQRQAPAVAKAAAKPVIMVVDDSITVRKVTARHLERNNMDVLAAKDGVDAMEQLRENVPDLMLVDIEMPRMDGYELTANVRSDPALKHVPIIMITSRAGDKHRERAMKLGVNMYMTKPYQEDQLLAAIESLLSQGPHH